MRLKRAFRILTDNFNNVFKMLLYRGIMLSLSLGLIYLVLSLGLNGILESAEASTITTMIGDFFRALVTGNSEYLVSFSEAFPLAVTDFLNLLIANIGSIVGSVVGVVVLYLIFRFLNGIATFAVCSIINDRMSLNGENKFCGRIFSEYRERNALSAHLCSALVRIRSRCACSLLGFLLAVFFGDRILGIFQGF